MSKMRKVIVAFFLLFIFMGLLVVNGCKKAGIETDIEKDIEDLSKNIENLDFSENTTLEGDLSDIEDLL